MQLKIKAIINGMNKIVLKREVKSRYGIEAIIMAELTVFAMADEFGIKPPNRAYFKAFIDGKNVLNMDRDYRYDIQEAEESEKYTFNDGYGTDENEEKWRYYNV